MRNIKRTMIPVAVLAAALAAVTAQGTDRPDTVYREAGQAIHRGDFDVAIRQLNAVIASAPKEAKLRGLRGVAWLRKGDYAHGAADLKAAIELNPGDAGQQFRPSSTAALSPDALRHGEEQVKRMLHDRPAMAQYSEETEPMRRWAARKFAGEDFAAPIDWDPSPPLHSDAENLAPRATPMPPSSSSRTTPTGRRRDGRAPSRSFGPVRSTNSTTSPTRGRISASTTKQTAEK